MFCSANQKRQPQFTAKNTAVPNASSTQQQGLNNTAQTSNAANSAEATATGASKGRSLDMTPMVGNRQQFYDKGSEPLSPEQRNGATHAPTPTQAPMTEQTANQVAPLPSHLVESPQQQQSSEPQLTEQQRKERAERKKARQQTELALQMKHEADIEQLKAEYGRVRAREIAEWELKFHEVVERNREKSFKQHQHELAQYKAEQEARDLQKRELLETVLQLKHQKEVTQYKNEIVSLHEQLQNRSAVSNGAMPDQSTDALRKQHKEEIAQLWVEFRKREAQLGEEYDMRMQRACDESEDTIRALKAEIASLRHSSTTTVAGGSVLHRTSNTVAGVPPSITYTTPLLSTTGYRTLQPTQPTVTHHSSWANTSGVPVEMRSTTRLTTTFDEHSYLRHTSHQNPSTSPLRPRESSSAMTASSAKTAPEDTDKAAEEAQATEIAKLQEQIAIDRAEREAEKAALIEKLNALQSQSPARTHAASPGAEHHVATAPNNSSIIVAAPTTSTAVHAGPSDTTNTRRTAYLSHVSPSRHYPTTTGGYYTATSGTNLPRAGSLPGTYTANTPNNTSRGGEVRYATPVLTRLPVASSSMHESYRHSTPNTSSSRYISYTARQPVEYVNTSSDAPWNSARYTTTTSHSRLEGPKIRQDEY